MIVRCADKECDWSASSASNLAELDYIFHHGPDTLDTHTVHRGDVYSDNERFMRSVRPDGLFGGRYATV